MFYFTEMTFEEQIRVIELKELSAEDKRQIYTELVCISLERDFDFCRGDFGDGGDIFCNGFKQTNTVNEIGWKPEVTNGILQNNKSMPKTSSNQVDLSEEVILNFPNKFLKIQRYKPGTDIGTDMNVILSFTTSILWPFKIVH